MIKIVEEVVKEYENLIYKLANSFNSSYKEDLYQVGVIGLIDAYNNYDSSYNVKFSTYAYPFILGEMKKFVRENRGIKVSREISYLSSRLDRLTELLYQKYKRMPTVEELSIETGIDKWKIIEAIGIRNCIRSIDEPISSKGKDITLVDVIRSNDSFESEIEVSEALDSLEDDEKVIALDRFIYDRSQSEVANMMGYSQAKVSRKEQKIITKIKEYYKAS